MQHQDRRAIGPGEVAGHPVGILPRGGGLLAQRSAKLPTAVRPSRITSTSKG